MFKILVIFKGGGCEWRFYCNMLSFLVYFFGININVNLLVLILYLCGFVMVIGIILLVFKLGLMFIIGKLFNNNGFLNGLERVIKFVGFILNLENFSERDLFKGMVFVFFVFGIMILVFFLVLLVN